MRELEKHKNMNESASLLKILGVRGTTFDLKSVGQEKEMGRHSNDAGTLI